MRIRISQAILSTLLSTCLLAPALVSCSGPDSSDPTDTEPAETVPSAVVIEDGIARYTLVHSEEVASQMAEEIEQMQTVFSEMYQTTLPVSTEPVSPCIQLSMGGDMAGQYSVTLDEKGNLLLQGGSKAALARAIDRFLTTACYGSGTSLVLTEALNVTYTWQDDFLDNSGMLSYIPTEQVKLTASNAEGTLLTPEWVDSLIMVEIRPDTASLGGTLAECYDLVDFYAEMGVNGIWLTPIHERGAGGNGYGNYGPHTVEPALTGQTDYEKGWEVVKRFVNDCHEKGIYVFFDTITWGVMRSAPLVTEHPDWFDGEAWGNVAFNWKNEEFVEWFTQTCVENILKTGADGFRCDCEPNFSGYPVYEEIRKRLAAQGKHVMIMSEAGNTRQTTYDLEQHGVTGGVSLGETVVKKPNVFLNGNTNLIRSVTKGEGLEAGGSARYYTHCLSSHDYQGRSVKGNRLWFGYSAIYAPYIPLWYMGEEFNAKNGETAVLYDERVKFGEANTVTNRYLLEDIKQMIRIRRTYPEIFSYFPTDHRTSNLCALVCDGLDLIPNYARYAGNRAVLIVSNNEAKASGVVTVTVPFEKTGLDSYNTFTVTDLNTGTILFSGTKEEITQLRVYVPLRTSGVYLVEGVE